MHAARHFSRKQLGDFGERLVAFAFVQRGYRVLGQQVRTRFGEIDVIARRDDTVLFIEVKTRRGNRYGYPEEAVTRTKMLHLSRAAQVLAPRFAYDCHWALVVVAVEIDVTTGTARLRRVEVDS